MWETASVLTGELRALHKHSPPTIRVRYVGCVLPKHVWCVYNNSSFVLTYSVATYSSEDVFFGEVPVELHTEQRLAMFFLRRCVSHV